MSNLSVLYEDNHLLALIKPQNMPVQRDDSNDLDLLTAAKQYIAEKYAKPGAVYLGLVHRLDRPVGGVMVFARTSKAANRLTSSMQSGEWEKKYLAVTYGKIPENGEFEDYLAKDEATNTSKVVDKGDLGAKNARLRYCVIKRAEDLSLIEVELLTGRHHQIRVQFSSRGYFLWGDARYNPSHKAGQQIALWSHSLSIIHPVSKEPCTFICNPPMNLYPWSIFEGAI